MSGLAWFILIVLLVNTLGAIITVLGSHRDISTTWAWLLVLLFLPVVGFFFYLFAGRGLSARKLRQIQAEYTRGIAAFVTLQKHENTHGRLLPPKEKTPAAQALVGLLLNIAEAPILTNTDVTIFTDGPTKFAALFADIEAAHDYIFIEYYTIYNDALGNQLRDLLIQKAQAGVTVRVIYDAWGSMGASRRFWRPLVAAGGAVESYFSSQYLFLDFRLNYRDHRKLVIIDDHVGYIGGFNVGDQYVSRNQKFGFWRDTHLRLIGNTVMALKVQFTMDWNATVGLDQQLPYAVAAMPLLKAPTMQNAIQIVASGPDNPTQAIKSGYVKMINSATRSIWIQTPYLIPDDTVQDALISAALAGIDVRIMIPNMPDHPFIYRATQYYANALCAAGVKVYHYQKGFLHAKTVVLDHRIASVGTANLDIRSFKLNFEVNAFIYATPLAQQLTAIFEKDMQDALLLTPALIKQQSFWLRFKQYGSRLLSPIL